MTKILIVGAGIAGLACARLLIKSSNFEVHLVEKEDEWPSEGLGVYIPSNGMKALAKMGLGAKALQCGFLILKRDVLDSHGKRIVQIGVEEIWGRKYSCLGIHRKLLHRILFDPAELPHLKMNCSVSKIQEHPDKVAVTFSDGDSDDFDVLIAADGLFSECRNLILGDIRLRQANHAVCRFLVKRPKKIRSWTLFMDHAGQFLVLPINENQAYCFVNNKRARDLPRAEFMQPFKTFASPIPAIINEWDPEACYWDELHELPSLNIYGKSRVVLIGDAAHGMPPYMTQGVSLALEDALVLANLLNNQKDLSLLSEDFTRIRKERIEWTLTRSHQRERLSKLPFWLTGLGMRAFGKKTWIADYRPLNNTPAW